VRSSSWHSRPACGYRSSPALTAAISSWEPALMSAAWEKAVLRTWTAERGGGPQDPLFPARTGRRLSRDAIERRLRTHAITAAENCPGLQGKNLHPHVLRHSCTMDLLRSGVDTTVIALWLGHADIRSTQAYLNSQELHQPGEKTAGQQVTGSPEQRSALPDASLVTWEDPAAIPSDARSAHQGACI
jgi:integrase